MSLEEKVNSAGIGFHVYSPGEGGGDSEYERGGDARRLA